MEWEGTGPNSSNLYPEPVTTMFEENLYAEI